MPKAVHITAIAPYKIYPAKMGGQKGIAFFYKYLSRLLNVTLISATNNRQPDDLTAEFLPILGNSRLRYINPFLFFRIRSIIRKKQSTHLIIEHPYYGWLGMLLQKFCKVKLIIHSHNIESVRFRSTGKWWWRILWHYEKFVHHKAAINFFVTKEDSEFAIEKFGLEPKKCEIITYGFELNSAPAPAEKLAAKKMLQNLWAINSDEMILLFNGTLDYKPNLDALLVIIDKINPILLEKKDFKYKIIICGKNLPDEYNGLKSYHSKNIRYAGFVDDISVYFKGSDIFLNPVQDGGGIKTKLVEALGYNLFCVSTEAGATGVEPRLTGEKLLVIREKGWNGFATSLADAVTDKIIPQAFFNHFYWGNIARAAVAVIQQNDQSNQ